MSTNIIQLLSRALFGNRILPDLVALEGLPLPPVQLSLQSWKKQVDDIRSMELRQDDVILCAYPKSGKNIDHMVYIYSL